jgi:phage protein U
MAFRVHKQLAWVGQRYQGRKQQTSIGRGEDSVGVLGVEFYYYHHTGRCCAVRSTEGLPLADVEVMRDGRRVDGTSSPC